MHIVRVGPADVPLLAPLAAEFRAALRSFKGIESEPDLNAAKEEITAFLQEGYPVFAAEEDGEYAGYLVCRIEEPTLWVEQIYVRDAYRRKGIASSLFRKAEEIAASMGEETVFNYVHPNNEAMIAFLRAKGYTVLNMIEIRKPYRGETPQTKIDVNGISFDY